MALFERLESEVREDRRQPISHSTEVVGIATAAECEVHRPVELPQRVDVELTLVERGEEGADARWSLRHPRRRRTVGRRGWVDAGRQLQAQEPGHEPVRW